MTLAPEQHVSTSEVPLVTFGVQSRNIDAIYSKMAGSYGIERTFGIDTNWGEISDYRYDIYTWPNLSVELGYKKLDGPGRPQYSNTYYLTGEFRFRREEDYFYLGRCGKIQKELDKLGVHADVTKVRGHEVLLLENLLVHMETSKTSGSSYETIFVCQHEFDPVKGYFVSQAFPLTTAEDFAAKFHIFENIIEKLITARYAEEGKHLPEAKLILTPHVEQESKSPRPALVPCDYCASRFESNLGSCPHCGGPRGNK